MATGNFAKDSSAPLGTADANTEAEEVTGHGFSETPSSIPDINGATSSASKTKKAKIAENKDEGLVSAFKSVGESLSNAIKMVANPNEVPEGLFETLTDLLGFDPAHLSMYYRYLVGQPNEAKAFMNLPFEYKMSWVAMFISERFPGQ